jgi:hypothetical protein
VLVASGCETSVDRAATGSSRFGPRYQTLGAPAQLLDLDHPRLTESSGLAVSRRRADALWTHNDSGGGPYLYAFRLEGEPLGRFPVDSAWALDWEDLASAKLAEGPVLLIADSGDNLRLRGGGTLYLVEEPDPATPEAGANLLQAIDYRYGEGGADGSLDCEAVAIDAAQRQVLLVSKSWRPDHPPTRVYQLALPAEPGRYDRDARRIATLDEVRMVTAMDVSADGRRMVLLTGAGIRLFEREAGEAWSAALARPGRTVEAPRLPRAEAICFSRDGERLFVTAEGRPTPLWLIPIRP